MRVVLTGPAIDGCGKAILRANLIKACKEAGIEVQGSVRADTTLLVASRTDTVKAKAAESRGIPVVTYPQFIATFLRGINIEEGGAPNPYTDKVNLDMLVPDFTNGKQVELELMDIL
jgi:BRCA1 C Terminus (BRCT) domain.